MIMIKNYIICRRTIGKNDIKNSLDVIKEKEKIWPKREKFAHHAEIP